VINGIPKTKITGGDGPSQKNFDGIEK